MKWAFLFSLISAIATVLAGCEPLMVLDPKGPQAETQAKDIWFQSELWRLLLLGFWPPNQLC